MIIGFTQLMMYDIGTQKVLSNFADAALAARPTVQSTDGRVSQFKLQASRPTSADDLSMPARDPSHWHALG